MIKLSKEVRSEPSIKNKKIMLPNDPEINCSKIRKINGIPINHSLFLELQKLGENYKEKLKYFPL